MDEVTAPEVEFYPQAWPIPPKSAARKRIPAIPSPITRGVLRKSGRSAPYAYQATGSPLTVSTSTSVTIPCSRPRASSMCTEQFNVGLGSSESGTYDQPSTILARDSDTSLNTAKTKILIEPSQDLQVMQSTRSDTHRSRDTTPLHISDRSPGHKRVSFHTTEVHTPTGCPQWLARDLNPINRANRLGAPKRSVSGPAKSWGTDVKRASQASDRIEPTTTVYGPSDEDIDSLIERQKTWDEEQQKSQKRLSWRPLQRFASLSKELKRTLSMGRRKKSFEPRTSLNDQPIPPIRSKSEKQFNKMKMTSGVLRRANTTAAAYTRRRSTIGEESELRKDGCEVRKSGQVVREDSKWEKRR